MKISGRVLDYTDNSPLAGASISVLNRSGQVFTGTLADAQGFFSIDNSLIDLYSLVQISYVGYGMQGMSATAANGTIYMQRGGTTMDEVVVIGKRALKKSIPVILLVLFIVAMLFLFAKLFKTSIIKQTIKI